MYLFYDCVWHKDKYNTVRLHYFILITMTLFPPLLI